MDSPDRPRTVRCPRCGRPAAFSSDNANRPFCSERCRLIDLGAWADEAYAIPARSHETDSDEGEFDGARGLDAADLAAEDLDAPPRLKH